jgi:glycosyltransferase involved in cell wall biosynthesis
MPNLLLCMTPGIGLNTWESIGSLKRELSTYVEYVRRGWKVKILTFDKGEISDLPEGIKAVRFPNRYLLFLLPWTHRKLGEWADVIKTNQSVHAYLYTKAARYWKKPILLRCGYVHGEYLESINGRTSRVMLYQYMEAGAFQRATCCQVPTEELSTWVHRRYRVPEKKITVVPNFVNIDLFSPMPVEKRKRSIISVGRLVPVKRYELLINACAEIPGCRLTIVGEGPERQNLEDLAREKKLDLNLTGNLPNEELPLILQANQVFAITSSWEGHPKALVEAMACGMPCLCVDGIGIKNIIENGKNGWSVKALHDSLFAGISELFEKQVLCDNLSRGAREYVLNHYGFNTCFSREYDSISSIVCAK